MAAKKQESSAVPFVIGATAVLGAIGAYVIYGTEAGKPARKMIKSWSLKAKAEVMERLEAMEHVTEEAYHDAVDAVVGTYKSKVDEKEIAKLTRELLGYWKSIKAGATKAKGQVKKSATKVAKKATKKSK